MSAVSELFNYLGFWTWLIIGLFLMAIEVFLPGVFVIWIGLAAFITGLVLSLTPELSVSYQFLIFTGLSLICVFFGWYIYGKVLTKIPDKDHLDLNNRAGSYVGKEFDVLENSDNGRTRIKIGDTVWLAECDTKLKAGDRVKVESADGVVLKVKRV